MLSLLAVLMVSQAESPRVLVVINENSFESREVGSYYIQKRKIPEANVVRIKTVTTDDVPYADYTKDILTPVAEKLIARGNRIDYIVLTTRVPLRIDNGGGQSVDSNLAVLRFEDGRKKQPGSLANPYYEKKERFRNSKFGIYLVTRLDGYSVADCKRLVDNGVNAKKQKGLFVLDGTPTKEGEFGRMNEATVRAAKALEAKGMQVQHDTAPPFLTPNGTVMGYVSWGSNDHNFKKFVWDRMSFHPGAIAETFVSTSARTFRHTTGGQSLIADLIARGVTGVKGYVSEPYLYACAKPDILLDRYTSGYNLAESFYAASPVVKWKDVVIGDPLAKLD